MASTQETSDDLKLEDVADNPTLSSAFYTFLEEDGGFQPYFDFWMDMRKFHRWTSEEKRKRSPTLVNLHFEGALSCVVTASERGRVKTEPVKVLESVEGRLVSVLFDCLKRFQTSPNFPQTSALSSTSAPLTSSSPPISPPNRPSSPPSCIADFSSRKPLPPPSSASPARSPMGPPPSSPPSSKPLLYSLDEIKKLKFKEVLKDQALLHLFQAFLCEELADENLLFYQELQIYRDLEGGEEEHLTKSQEISTVFFSDSSPHAFFCTAAEKESMEELKGTKRMFEVIEGRVLMELSNHFRRFVSSGKLSRALSSSPLSSPAASPLSSPLSSPPYSPPSSPPSSPPTSSLSSKKNKRKSRTASSDADSGALSPRSKKHNHAPTSPYSPPLSSSSPDGDSGGPASPRLFSKKNKKSRSTASLSINNLINKKSPLPPPESLTGEGGTMVVKKLKLKDVFADDYLLFVFEKYVEAEMAGELMLFWKEIRVYRGLGGEGERKEKRDDVWELFFKDKSPHRMFLTGLEREELEEKKKGGEVGVDLFLNVESRVWRELSDVFRKLIASGKLLATIETDHKAWQVKNRAASPPPSKTQKKEKKEKKEKEKDSDKRDDKKEKRKKKEEEEKGRYVHLDASDLTSSKNPNKMSLLHPSTQEAIIKAGIPVQEAEQNSLHWAVLMNSLRFLKIDSGLRFRKKITASGGVPLDEAPNLLAGPVPSKLKVSDQIGEGAFGQVFKCRYSPLGKGSFALKKMLNDTDKHTKMNLREIQVLKENPHPNIVKFHAAYIAKSEYWAVCELLEGGTLEEGHSEFLEEHIAYAAKKILSALSYLHSKNIVHRDLKSANIMLDIEGRIKLIDFGLSVCLGEGPQVQMCGSPYWLSPEMIRMDPHSFPTDIWSFAVSLLEMINGQPPNKDNPVKLMYDVGTREHDSEPVVQLDDPNKWSPVLKDFLGLCLQADPAKRATADELLKHKLISKACSKDKMAQVLTQIFIKHSLEDIGLGI